MKKNLYVVAIFSGVMALLCWGPFQQCLELRQAQRDSAYSMSESDDPIIEEALRSYFSQSMGYTLIGLKPVSIDYCTTILPFVDRPGYRLIFFQYLEQLFSKSNCYLLKTFHEIPGFTEFILVHKPALFKSIQKEPYLKKFVLQQYGSLQSFVEALYDPKLHIVDCFKGDSIALGIALGYGEENSRLYHRRNEVGEYLVRYPAVQYFLPLNLTDGLDRVNLPSGSLVGIPPKLPAPHLDTSLFASLEEEWVWIQQVQNRGHQQFELPYLFQLPLFVSKKGPETEKIRNHYKKGRAQLTRLFSGRKFGEVIAEVTAKQRRNSPYAESDHLFQGIAHGIFKGGMRCK